MQRSTRGHRKEPPSSTIPSNDYPSSPRDYDIMPKGGSDYEHGVGYAHRGGYGLSDHRDENMNPSQYQNRFEVLEPWQGGSDVRLPGIEALDKLLRQDNWPPTSGGDAAGRVPENQNPHCIEAQSKNSRMYADALGNRPMQKFRCAPRQDSSRYASSETKTHEQPISDYICIERESLARHSSPLNNTRESGNKDTRAERDTQGKNPIIQEFEF